MNHERALSFICRLETPKTEAYAELQERQMNRAKTKKSTPLVSKDLLLRLEKEAKSNGQSVRDLIEKAVKHYLDVVLPSSNEVRSEVLQFADKNISKYDELLKRLAKAK